jgi:signal transduction histidine kinase/ActR/RegA family two-component response regulator
MKRFAFSRFALLSLFSIAGLALAMGFAISSLLSRAVSAWEWENTAALVRREVQIDSLEEVFAQPAAPGARQRWSDLSRMLLSLPEVVRVKVWGPDATILWSDEAHLIGLRFPDNDELEQALTGKLEVEIKSLTKAEHGFERRAFDTLAEVYVPIHARPGGPVIGVVEVYKLPARLFTTIRWARLVIWAISLIGGLVLYLGLHPLFTLVYRKQVEEETLRAHAQHLEAEIAQRTEQLLQAQKMEAVGLLAGGIAHDFNNLLTVIMSRASLLLQRPPSDEAAAGLALIQQTAQRAAGLTRQLLTFSRKQVLQPRLLDLNRVVADMTDMLRPLLGERIALGTALAPRLGLVSADQGHIEQVIMNLAVNARDAMPDGGRLTVETADSEVDDNPPAGLARLAPGRYVRLAVSDTGVGIDPAIQARIFEPFFTTKPPAQGTGLGLSTVYGIVRQHGGHISVESASGRGTTFTIHLPRAQAMADLASTPDAGAAPARPWETILVVEDEAEVRTVAVEILRDAGYTVLEATDGLQALQLAARQRVPLHLLVTDVVMPSLNGWELAQRLTTMRPGLKVLFMTGYSEITLAQHERPAGHLLQKPFTPDSLLRKVREALPQVPVAS